MRFLHFNLVIQLLPLLYHVGYGVPTETTTSPSIDYCGRYNAKDTRKDQLFTLNTQDAHFVDQEIMDYAKHNDTVFMIRVHVHVICRDTWPLACPSESEVKKQMQVLKDAYLPLGFNMSLGTLVYYNSSRLHAASSRSQMGWNPEMRSFIKQTKIGGRMDMNVYIKSTTADGFTGTTMQFPHELDSSYEEQLDGIIVDYQTLPGQRLERMFGEEETKGLTMIHEAGHFLGLFHTFEGDCASEDILYGIQDDTAAQMAMRNMYPAERMQYIMCRIPDLCETSSGLPIWSGWNKAHQSGEASQQAIQPNYMDYTPDSCDQVFTKGQRAQARYSWLQWRMNK